MWSDNKSGKDGCHLVDFDISTLSEALGDFLSHEINDLKSNDNEKM